MDFINKNLSKIAGYAVGAITIVLFLLFFFGSEDAVSYNNIEYQEPAMTSTFLSWTMFVVGLAVVLTLGFVLVKFVAGAAENPKTAIKPVAVVVGALALFGITYALGNGTPLNIPGYDGTDNTEGWLKLTDMFLYVSYILVGASVVLIGYSIVKKYFDK